MNCSVLLIICGAILVAEHLKVSNAEPLPASSKTAFRTSFRDNANTFVDDVLEKLMQETGALFDPMSLEEYQTGFSQRILLVTFSCQAKLYNGFVTGLKSMHRTGDFYLTNVTNDKQILSGFVGFNNLIAGYSIRLEAIGVAFELPMMATVESANVNLELAMDRTAKKAKFTKYQLELGKIKVSLKNLGPFSWVADPITSFIVNLLRPLLSRIIQVPVRNAVEEAFSNYVPFD